MVRLLQLKGLQVIRPFLHFRLEGSRLRIAVLAPKLVRPRIFGVDLPLGGWPEESHGIAAGWRAIRRQVGAEPERTVRLDLGGRARCARIAIVAGVERHKGARRRLAPVEDLPLHGVDRPAVALAARGEKKRSQNRRYEQPTALPHDKLSSLSPHGPSKVVTRNNLAPRVRDERVEGR